MSKSEYNMFSQMNCSASSLKKIKTRCTKILKYLKNNESEFDEDFWMHSELYLLLPAVEENLKTFFVNIIFKAVIPKKRTDAFSSFLEEFENLLTFIFEQLSLQKMSYVIIPCVCSIASMMYYVEETFAVSQDILTTIFARFNQLRFFVVDTIYRTIILLQSQNLIAKYMESISKTILLLMQSVPTVFVCMNDEQFEKTQQQLQSLTIHLILLFLDDINSKSTSENVAKLFNQLMRHILKLSQSFKFPSSLFMLTTVVRKMMSCMSSSKNSLPLKKFALEQICFIIVNIKKVVYMYADSKENKEVVMSINKNVESKLKKPKKCMDVEICLKILLIHYMEEQYKNYSDSSSPVPYFRFNFLRLDASGNENEKTADSFAKRRKINELFSTDMDTMKYYGDLLAPLSINLNRKEADIIYQYLLFSNSELRIFIDSYLEKTILLTSVRDNSIRLSAVKQLVPLIEANNSLLSSRILKIAIRSLILDHSCSVRESILVALTKIILLYEPPTYVVIFEENWKSILMRLLDVNVTVRKAVLNLLKNFCLKNRNDKNILKILSCILCRLLDKDEAVKFQIVEIFKHLWFTSSQDYDNSVLEAFYLSNRNPNEIITLFKYIFSVNREDTSVMIFNLYKEIVTRVLIDQKKIQNLDTNNFVNILKSICCYLSQENVIIINQFMKQVIRLKQKRI